MYPKSAIKWKLFSAVFVNILRGPQNKNITSGHNSYTINFIFLQFVIFGTYFRDNEQDSRFGSSAPKSINLKATFVDIFSLDFTPFYHKPLSILGRYTS